MPGYAFGKADNPVSSPHGIEGRHSPAPRIAPRGAGALRHSCHIREGQARRKRTGDGLRFLRCDAKKPGRWGRPGADSSPCGFYHRRLDAGGAEMRHRFKALEFEKVDRQDETR
jgi:hypothetical protein